MKNITIHVEGFKLFKGKGEKEIIDSLDIKVAKAAHNELRLPYKLDGVLSLIQKTIKASDDEIKKSLESLVKRGLISINKGYYFTNTTALKKFFKDK